MIYTDSYESPLGSILLAGDEEGLTGLWFREGSRYVGQGLSRDAVPRDMAYFDQAKQWLFIGSAFRNRVGEMLCEIPFGQTVTYGQIAARIARERGSGSMSAQAVGGAVGHNPISVIVPCHRVVGADGNLTGYGGGIQRKKALLKLEGVDMSQLTRGCCKSAVSMS